MRNANSDAVNKPVSQFCFGPWTHKDGKEHLFAEQVKDLCESEFGKKLMDLAPEKRQKREKSRAISEYHCFETKKVMLGIKK